MTTYHILGANIPHHNRTLLTFFLQELAAKLPLEKALFYVVGEAELAQAFLPLKLVCFPTKWRLARAVVQAAKSQRQAKFVLHGQFNFPLWFAILSGKLPACRCVWHVWGADLYEQSTAWKFKLLYPFRRLAQQKLPEIWATRGDLGFAHRYLKRSAARDKILYFPTKIPPNLPTMPVKSRHFTILLGNSGDPANRHCAGLDEIYRRFGTAVRILIPMGYPVQNQAYLAQVERHAKRLFPQENVQILQEKWAFYDYVQLLAQCDLGLFLFERQQGIGTICSLIHFNIPVALAANNPFCADMAAENVPFLSLAELNLSSVAATKQQLLAMDKRRIGFFPPNYLPQWIKCLTE